MGAAAKVVVRVTAKVAAKATSKKISVIVCICLLLPLGACRYVGPTSVPIGSEYYVYDEGNTELVLLLPGIGESPAAFVKNDVVEAIQRCRPGANMLGVDAHFGYYRNRSIVNRLREDVIGPARANGQTVWLLGNSLGGLGSLIYTRQYPQDISRVFLMAPYIGEWSELSAYLHQKNEPDLNLKKELDADFVELWGWLESESAPSMMALAYGEDDKFKRQLSWLGNQLGTDRVLTTEGKHRWEVWRKLWPSILAASGECTGSVADF